jgi:hypothetical protein
MVSIKVAAVFVAALTAVNAAAISKRETVSLGGSATFPNPASVVLGGLEEGASDFSSIISEFESQGESFASQLESYGQALSGAANPESEFASFASAFEQAAEFFITGFSTFESLGSQYANEFATAVGEPLETAFENGLQEAISAFAAGYSAFASSANANTIAQYAQEFESALSSAGLSTSTFQQYISEFEKTFSASS